MRRQTTGYILFIFMAVMSLTSCDFPQSSHEFFPIPSAVTVDIPDIPDRFVIAGDTIDLRSYENRERFDRELLAFTYSHTNTLLSIKRANRYFPVIERILKENGIPDDMKYLAVVESYLYPTARSGAGAAGMWQFMESTGKEYDLQVDKNVDQRLDIVKSTEAACRYMKQAYSRFGDWLAVAASYNAGQGRIKGFREKHLSDIATHWWMSEETTRYIFRLMAVKMIFSDPKAYGFVIRESQLYPPLVYREVKVNRDIDDLALFAKQQGVTYYQFKDANPWLRQGNLNCRKGAEYVLKIPTAESMRYDPDTVKAHCKTWIIDP